MEENNQPIPQTPPKKRAGAPKGNQNARKHGFYSDVLDDEEYKALQQIRGYDDLDVEIELMRVKIQSIARHDPNNVRLLIDATNNLARLMKTREKLAGTVERNRLKNGITNVWREVATQFLSEPMQKQVLTRLANGQSVIGGYDDPPSPDENRFDP